MIDTLPEAPLVFQHSEAAGDRVNSCWEALGVSCLAVQRAEGKLDFGFSVLGWIAYITARSTSSPLWYQYVFVSVDFAWMAFIALYPNPFAPDGFASFIALRSGAFFTFLILLAGLAFPYQPRLVVWGGVAAAVSWAGGALLLSQNTNTVASLLLGSNLDSHLSSSVSPYFIDVSARIWEVVVFLVVAL